MGRVSRGGITVRQLLVFSWNFSRELPFQLPILARVHPAHQIRGVSNSALEEPQKL